MSISLMISNLGLLSGMAGWKQLESTSISAFTQFTSDPVLKSQISYFQDNIGSATTASALLSNARLTDVALTAYGLTDQISATGLMTQVLNSDLDDSSSLANKMASSSYKAIAKAFGYGSDSDNVTSASFVDTVVSKYTQAKFDEVVSNTSDTLANALYAQQNLSSISNWYSVIADTNLATVVETALHLPASNFATLDVDQQYAILSSKMNVKDLQDPDKVSKLLDDYVAIATAEDSSSSSSDPGLTLITALTSGDSSDSSTFGLDLSSLYS